MSRTGPWPDTSTHLLWYFLNILSGLWDMMTWSWVIWGWAKDCKDYLARFVTSVKNMACLTCTTAVALIQYNPFCTLLTGTPRMWDIWSAFFCLRQFPALVTKTTGTTNCPWALTSFWNAFFAAGIGILPRTSTPSMSKRSPKRGCGCQWEEPQKGSMSS